VDLTGFICIPGLLDAHAHLSSEALQLDPADPDAIRELAARAVLSGVTVCLDKGWSDDVVLNLAPSVRSPRIAAAGRMLRSEDGYWPDFGHLADGSDLVEAVATLAPGRPWVKIVADWPRKGRGAIANYSEAVLAGAVAQAHAAGAFVATHTMAPEVANMAVRAGVDSIEHGLYLDADHLDMLGARGGIWVPTILRMEEVLAEMKPGSTGASVIGEGLENVRELLSHAVERGVTVMPGSDLTIAPSEIFREVAALVRYGLTPAQAVAGASAGHAVGLDMGFRAGLVADLVAVEGDPLQDVAALADPVVVIAAGKIILDRR